MPAQVQKEAPDFTAKAVVNGQITPDDAPYKLSSNRGKYVVLFFYPLDFTFVCPTEIIAFSDRIAEFEKRNCQVVGVSVDSQFSHLAWVETPRAKGGLGELKYPLVADLTKKISADYGVLLDAGISLRGLFVIDQKGIVRAITIHDLPLGRSVDEALRVLDALQHFEKHGEVCPADWKPGAATIDTKNAGAYFEKAAAGKK
ncbi:peroxiredoxin [Gemmata sp. G18]|uniref:Thioredoxin peroxidase n=1 Tax=Gemmata palustris TaxID=2822762 RepID=A0ABS5BXK7_9BACT|nr:peroxiredoxin [Gemmata palustris]MBP3958480.1 peroxiredoxin [Gemmata palustris]